MRSEFNSEDLFIRFVVFTETAKLPFYWVLRKIWNVLHQIHLEIRDWSVKISVSWLQPAACRQWFVLNLFQKERERERGRKGIAELEGWRLQWSLVNSNLWSLQEESCSDQWPPWCFMQIILHWQDGKISSQQEMIKCKGWYSKLVSQEVKPSLLGQS